MNKSLLKSNNKKGFTIVETLIAIAVLMISIAGPLVVATKGLTSAIISKDQMIASYLAQESMEVIKNQRYVNLSTPGTFWMNGITDLKDVCVEITEFCDASSISYFRINDKFVSNNSLVPLNYDSSRGYTHKIDSTLIPTKFSRYYYISKINDDEVTAHVVVSWNVGTIPYQIELTSQLTNAQR